MKDKTIAIHNQLKSLGERLDFETDFEVSKSVLALQVEEAYQPRVDLVWFVKLTAAQREALAWALAREGEVPGQLPVVGAEVEGTSPSTKTLASDVANLTAFGVPLGLLVVSEEGEANIYRRAVRAVRSVRRSFGDRVIVPMEAAWLKELLALDFPKTPLSQPALAAAGPANESNPWTQKARDEIVRRGVAAGFTVRQSYTPPVLARTYQWATKSGNTPLEHTTGPMEGVREEMTRAADYLTASVLDVAWLLPLPPGLSAFLEQVVRRDPVLAGHGLIFPELWTHLPVVLFELETSAGKHAGGGLLNLSAFGVLGVTVTPSDELARQLDRTLKRYRPTLGLRNVSVRALPLPAMAEG